MVHFYLNINEVTFFYKYTSSKNSIINIIHVYSWYDRIIKSINGISIYKGIEWNIGIITIIEFSGVMFHITFREINLSKCWKVSYRVVKSTKKYTHPFFKKAHALYSKNFGLIWGLYYLVKMCVGKAERWRICDCMRNHYLYLFKESTTATISFIMYKCWDNMIWCFLS